MRWHRDASACRHPCLQTSELLAANTAAIAAASVPSGPPPSAAGGTYAAGLRVQLRELLGRQFMRLWRLPGYSALRLIVAVLFALVLGSLYWDKGQVGEGRAAGVAGGSCVAALLASGPGSRGPHAGARAPVLPQGNWLPPYSPTPCASPRLRRALPAST